MLDHLDPSNPKHAELRAMLRLAGPVIAAVGLVFTAIGLISFFSAFGGGSPRLFWCAFVGLPMTAIGVAITKFAYLGAIKRYMANEASPVGRDVVNYMAEQTKGSVRDLAAAVGKGIQSAQADDKPPTAAAPAAVKVRCRVCRALNDETAKFCNQCGEKI